MASARSLVLAIAAVQESCVSTQGLVFRADHVWRQHVSYHPEPVLLLVVTRAKKKSYVP